MLELLAPALNLAVGAILDLYPAGLFGIGCIHALFALCNDTIDHGVNAHSLGTAMLGGYPQRPVVFEQGQFVTAISGLFPTGPFVLTARPMHSQDGDVLRYVSGHIQLHIHG